MKKQFTLCLSLALSGALSPGLHAQIVNGSFETQYPGTPPSSVGNVLSQAAGQGSVDELPNWRSLSRAATYLSANATVPWLNPQSESWGGYAPNGGQGCVQIGRTPPYYELDEAIYQEVALIPQHTYRASFYALRRPGQQRAERLALSVTSTPPTYSNVISPTPYASIVSPPIGDGNAWTLVTGTFVASASTAYVIVGYDHSLGTYDPTLPGSPEATEKYAIDDVSLTDLTPAQPCPSGLTLSGATTDGPVPASPSWGPSVSTPGFSATGTVNVYTAVTLTVNGTDIGACIWSVYTSTGPNSYTSSANGNQFYITPLQPASATGPNGLPNVDQSYTVSCTVNNASCPAGEGMEYTLYSKPPFGDGSGSGPQRQGGKITVNAFPAPADHRVFVTVPKNETAHAFLYDQHGKLQRNLQFTGLGEIYLRDLKAGIYYLRVQIQGGATIEKRISIQH